MLILLWGLRDEAPLAGVADALRQFGADFLLLDQRQVLSTRVDLAVGKDIKGRVIGPELTINLEEVSAAYIRPYESRLLSCVADSPRLETAASRAAAVDELLLDWCNLTPALVLNRPRQMASNNCKPYQAESVRRCGFSTPHTLITTSPEAVKSFQEEHNALIYKSISGVRSRVTRLAPAHAERLPDIATCPTQFQQFVPGCDFRVHVVGQDIFASQLLCEADDYRYPGEHSLRIHSAQLSPDIEEQCLRLASSLDLTLAGIDLRRTPDGEWFCFEVNPSPAFTFYQDMTGQPIASAIASLLMSRVPMYSGFSLKRSFNHQDILITMDPSLSFTSANLWKN
jgi:RimK-like ATP-grasp domain